MTDPQRPDHPATPAEGDEASTTTASTTPSTTDPTAADATTVTQAAAMEAEAPAPPLTPPVVATSAETDAARTDDAATEPAAPEAKRRPRRLVFVAGLFWIVRWIFGLALFIAGVSIGNAIFQATQEPPVSIVDPSVNREPPAVVTEFIGALNADDADAIRSSLAAEPHARLTSEFKRFDIAEVTSVETLSTQNDGTRTATAVVLKGVTSAGVPIAINLVILADEGTIEGFR